MKERNIKELKLITKVNKELEEYKAEMLKKSPEKIFYSCYEIYTMQMICYSIQDEIVGLTDEALETLLSVDNPIKFVFDDIYDCYEEPTIRSYADYADYINRRYSTDY